MNESSEKVAVVTGAGSGVGRSTVLKLAARGWRVALWGRRLASLQETVSSASPIPEDRVLCCAVDVGVAADVEAASALVFQRFGRVDLLVNAAGVNVPQRSLEVLSLEDYHRMMNTNLNGAYYCAQAFLPLFRKQGFGTLIQINSEAGKQASPKAGPGYVMSKFGLTGLSQSINAEERGRGIRSCTIFPGDIDTPLLDKRPHVPDAQARARMLKPEDVADCVVFCAELPRHVVMEEMLVRPL